MKFLLTAAAFCIFSVAGAQDAPARSTPDTLLVEASCGQCKFGLAGTTCDLAVRMDGKAYFVDGTAIDNHGDAHAADGFCNAIRRARVVGNVAGGRFRSRYFQLLPLQPKKD